MYTSTRLWCFPSIISTNQYNKKLSVKPQPQVGQADKKPDAIYFWQWIWKMSCQGKSVSKTSCYPTYTKAPPAHWLCAQLAERLTRSLFSWRSQKKCWKSLLPQVQIMALTGLWTILHDEVTELKSIHAGHRTNKGLLCAVRKKLQEPP